MKEQNRNEIIPQPKQLEALATSEFETLYGGSRGGGKAQPITCNVLTPSGFKKIKDLRIGDKIIHPFEGISKITNIYPQGTQLSYKVEFIDGAITYATLDHLWHCWFTNTERKKKLHNTQEIIDWLEKNKDRKQRSSCIIPLIRPIEKPKKKLSISPYLLGLYLGDGCSRGTRMVLFSTIDKALLTAFCKEGYCCKQRNKYDYAIILDNNKKRERNKKGQFEINKSTFYNRLVDIGLANLKSQEKYIPNNYMNSNIQDRVALLQGLFDTDGYIDTRGHIEFTTTSAKLAKQVQYLIWELGGKATLKDYKTKYRIYIRIENVSLFRLQRKKTRFKKFNGGISKLGRRIKKITKENKTECACIQTDREDGLYITDDFIITHNTFAGILWLIKPYLIKNPKYRALVIRRNSDDLKDWIDRAGMIYNELGLGTQPTGMPPQFKFPSGAVIRTGHLKDENAYTKYQGHEYQRVLIEELNQIPTEKSYLQLISSCRTTVENIDSRVFATTNPGGAGHAWIKSRFVDCAPFNTTYIDTTTGRSRIYIPATIDDNPRLKEADPNYINFLEGLKNTDYELYKAWRHGDWEVFAGQFFREFRHSLHVIPPFVPRKKIHIFGNIDWGRVHNFAFYLTAVKEEIFEDINFYRALTFMEVYGNDKSPHEWAKIILERLRFFDLGLNDIKNIEADTQIFVPGNDKSKSIALQFADVNEGFRYLLKPASKDRIGGWENMHNWLSLAPDGQPYWLITENCENLIKTLPLLVHDENKVEDVMKSVGTDSIDDAADSMRYGLKAIKWIDARLGGVDKTKYKKMPKTAYIYKGKQVSVNLDEFATATENKESVYYKE
jgi:hypothetical protein